MATQSIEVVPFRGGRFLSINTLADMAGVPNATVLGLLGLLKQADILDVGLVVYQAKCNEGASVGLILHGALEQYEGWWCPNCGEAMKSDYTVSQYVAFR